MCDSVNASTSASRGVRNRVLGLLQTSSLVLDFGWTGLLCRHPQHDWRLVKSHFEEDQRRGLVIIRLHYFSTHSNTCAVQGIVVRLTILGFRVRISPEAPPVWSLHVFPTFELVFSYRIPKKHAF